MNVQREEWKLEQMIAGEPHVPEMLTPEILLQERS
jgi:hypothetical protein